MRPSHTGGRRPSASSAEHTERAERALGAGEPSTDDDAQWGCGAPLASAVPPPSRTRERSRRATLGTGTLRTGTLGTGTLGTGTLGGAAPAGCGGGCGGSEGSLPLPRGGSRGGYFPLPRRPWTFAHVSARFDPTTCRFPFISCRFPFISSTRSTAQRSAAPTREPCVA